MLRFLLIGCLLGCSGRESAAPAYPGYSEGSYDRRSVSTAASADASYESAYALESTVSEREVSYDEPAPAMAAAPAAAPVGQVHAAQRAPAQPAARMVQYNGSLQLATSSVSDTLKTLVELASAQGGWVEELSDSHIALRVPVAAFFKTLERIETLGDVQNRALSAQDVTAAFTELTLRISILTKSRDRLIGLLALTKSEVDKLAILNEVRRLTEAVDQLTLQQKAMRSLADFSRITTTVIQRAVPTVAFSNLEAFRWIEGLGPWHRSFNDDDGLLTLTVPDGLVRIDDGDHFMAESADGVIVWTTRHDNHPRGSTDFWFDAIAARLRQQYTEAKDDRVGGYRVLHLATSATDFSYQVAVRAEGDALDVVEVYYPSPTHKERHAPAVLAVLAAGEAP